MSITAPKIFARGKKLYISFSANGKQIRKALNKDDTKANRNFVKKKIIPELLNEVYTGKFFKNSNIPTIDDYSKVSFENHKYNRKATTTKDYVNIYKKHIEPYFGSKQLDAVKVSDINKWKNRLYNELGLSSKRVNDIKKVLGTILQDAFEDEIISSNPVRKSKSLPKHTRKDKEPFTLEEVKLILDSCKGQVHNMFSLLFFTGMRTGEMIGLKWSDIDFDKNTISISRTVGRGIEDKPKTESSIRTIPILKPLLKPLQEQFKLTGHHNSYVFLNKNNTHYFDSSKIRDNTWAKTIEKSGVRYRTIYNTRHTFASTNLSIGKNILWVSQILGHKNANITLEYYAKYVPIADNESSAFDSMS